MSPGWVNKKQAQQMLGWLFLAAALVTQAACGEPAPTPFPTAAAVTRVPATPTPPVIERYTNEIAGFSFELPEGWQVVEQGVTRLGYYYLVGPEPLGPGPATSALFVAAADDLTAAEAAALLACAECEEEPELETVVAGGTEALRAVLGEPVAVEWFFVNQGDWLIFFTLHDPETLETRTDLLETFRLEGTAEAVAAATPAAPATPPPTPTPLPTTAAAVPRAVSGWQEVTASGAAISYAIPEAWEAITENEWAPDGLSPLRLGFRWQDFVEDPLDLLPAAEILAAQPLTVTWGQGISATLRTRDGLERHAVLQVGLRSYDFYSQGPAEESVAAMQPLLDHVLASVVLSDQLLYLEEPVATAVSWFAAALADAGGLGALPYMSAALKEQLEAGQSPLVLLELPQPPSIYQLEVLGEPGRFIDLQANLTLSGGSEAVRVLRMTFDQQIGWRLDAIIIPESDTG